MTLLLLLLLLLFYRHSQIDMWNKSYGICWHISLLYCQTGCDLYMYTYSHVAFLVIWWSRFWLELFYKRGVSGDTEPCDLLRVFRFTLSGPRSLTRCLLPSQLYLASLLRVCKLPQTFRWGFSRRHFDLLHDPPHSLPLQICLYAYVFFIFLFYVCAIGVGGSRWKWFGPVEASQPDGQIGHNRSQMSRDSWVIWRDDLIKCNVWVSVCLPFKSGNHLLMSG